MSPENVVAGVGGGGGRQPPEMYTYRPLTHSPLNTHRDGRREGSKYIFIRNSLQKYLYGLARPQENTLVLPPND